MISVYDTHGGKKGFRVRQSALSTRRPPATRVERPRRSTGGGGQVSGEAVILTEPTRTPLPPRRRPVTADDADGVCIRRAVSPDDIAGARKLARDVRAMLGFDPPEPISLADESFRGVPRTATFVGRSWPDVVAAATLVIDAEQGCLPADEAFRLELSRLRGRNRSICELVDVAVTLPYRRGDVPRALLRACVAQALLSERTDVVTVIHPWQQGDYATLGFRRMGPVRTLCSEAPDPVILSRLDLGALRSGAAAGIGGQDLGFLRRFYIDKNPYCRYVAKWSAQAGMARQEVA